MFLNLFLNSRKKGLNLITKDDFTKLLKRIKLFSSNLKLGIGNF